MLIPSQIFTLALKSIWRNKTRSFLTMLGIIIGVASVILLVSIGQGLQLYITKQFESLGTNLIVVLPGQVSLGGSGGSTFSSGPPNFGGSKLTVQQAEQIDRLGQPIEAAGAAIEQPASIQYLGKSKYTTVAGITSNYASLRNITVAEGRLILNSDVDAGRNVVIIGKSIARDFFGANDPIGKQVTIGSQRFQVIGILRDLGVASFGTDINNFVAMPISTGERVFGIKNAQVIAVKATSKEEVPAAIKKVKLYMSQRLKDDEFSVLDQASLVQTINQILGVLTVALSGIAAISLVVGGVGIMNIMLVSVTERTHEIGLRKAVGAKESDILIQFLIEAVVLSAFGGGIGILIGAGGALIVNQFISTAVTFWSVVLAFGVSATVGIVFGVTPAIRASRLDPIQALRYE